MGSECFEKYKHVAAATEKCMLLGCFSQPLKVSG